LRATPSYYTAAPGERRKAASARALRRSHQTWPTRYRWNAKSGLKGRRVTAHVYAAALGFLYNNKTAALKGQGSHLHNRTNVDSCMDTARMIDMLPADYQRFAYEFVKNLVLAWDPDFTKVTPEEAAHIKAAEESGYVLDSEVDWDKIGQRE